MPALHLIRKVNRYLGSISTVKSANEIQLISGFIIIFVILIVTSVSLENTPPVKLIPIYIRDPSGLFSISLLARALMTLFSAFSRLLVQTVSFSI